MKGRSVVIVMSQRRCRGKDSSSEWEATSGRHPGIDDVDYLYLKGYLASLSVAHSGVYIQNRVDRCPKLLDLEKGFATRTLRRGEEPLPFPLVL